MNFTQIRYFMVLSECLNFTVAARKLYITQPSLSKQISSMEEELGVRLFVRDRKTTQLTPAGIRFYDGCQKILSDYNKLVVETQGLTHGAPCTLTIGILEFQRFGQDLKNIRAVMEEALSCVEIRVIPAGYRALLEGLQDKTMDVIITTEFELQDHPDYLHRQLSRLENRMVLPADHPMAHREGVSLRDFQNEVFLTVADEETPWLTKLLRSSCREAGFEPRFRVAENYRSMMAMLEMGQGIFPLNTEHYLHNHPGLRFVSVAEIPDIHKVLAWNPNNMNPVIPVLVELIKQTVG